MPDVQALVNDFVLKLKRRMIEGSHACSKQTAELLQLVVFSYLPNAIAATDAADVQALGVLYSSLNNLAQLPGWTAGGGDRCGESWKGVSCAGSSVK